MKEFVRLRVETYLKGIIVADKKAKGTKKSIIKRKLKFQDFTNCLEAAQIENKINHLEQNKIDADNLKEDKKEFMKNSTLILKTQKRFISEIHNGFTEEINKINLTSNDNKGIH